MKNIKMLISIVLCLYPNIVRLQTPAQVYDKPLSEVLNEIQKKYDVVIAYDEKKIAPETVVASACWKFSAFGIENTLDNVLKPLNLSYKKGKGNKYELISYEYFRKPTSEGAKHLNVLKASYTTLSDWESRKSAVKGNIMRKLGLIPLPERTPLNAKVTNKRNYDGYNIENVSLEVLPGVYVCGSLYTPSKLKKANHAVMLCPHGHFYNKIDKSIPNERGRYRPDQQYRCAMLARMGVIVFSYDMFAWGESTLQVPLKDHRTGLAMTMQTWNAIRITDYLCSLPYTDQSRVGITGASGGGTQTFIAAAVDERITLSVPTVMVSCHFYGGCPCESGLPIHFLDEGIGTNNAEIAALCAPHPQLVISDGNDWTANLPEVEFPYLKYVYSLYDKPEVIENVHLGQEGHDYGLSKRLAMYDFVARHFNLDANIIKDGNGTFDESKITIESAENMYAFGKDRILPKNAVIGVENIKKLLEESKK